MHILDPREWGQAVLEPTPAGPLEIQWPWQAPRPLDVAPAVRTEALRPLSERGALAMGAGQVAPNVPVSAELMGSPNRPAVHDTRGEEFFPDVSRPSRADVNVAPRGEPPLQVTGGLPPAADTGANQSTFPAQVEPVETNASVPATQYKVTPHPAPASAASGAPAQAAPSAGVMAGQEDPVDATLFLPQQRSSGSVKVGSSESRSVYPVDHARLRKLSGLTDEAIKAIDQKESAETEPGDSVPVFDTVAAEKAGQAAYAEARARGLSHEEAVLAKDAAYNTVAKSTTDFVNKPSVLESKMDLAAKTAEGADALGRKRERMGEMAQLSREVREGERDELAKSAEKPVDYGRVERNRGFVGNLLAAITEAGGAYAATVGHTNNWAKQILDEGIERDIREQESERGQANKNLANAQANGEQVERGHVRRMADMDAQRIAMLEDAKLKLDAIDAKMLPANARVRHAEARLAVYEKLAEAYRKQYADQRMTTSTQFAAGGGGGVKPEEMGIPGGSVIQDWEGNPYAHVDEKKPDEAEKIREQYGFTKSATSTIDSLEPISQEEWSRLPDETRAKYEAKAAWLIQQLARAAHGRATESTIEEFKKNIVAPNDVYNPNNIARLRAIEDTLISDYRQRVKSANPAAVVEARVQTPGGEKRVWMLKHGRSGVADPVPSSAVPPAGPR